MISVRVMQALIQTQRKMDKVTAKWIAKDIRSYSINDNNKGSKDHE